MNPARNIYEQQAHNRRLTWLVMGGFGALVAFLGWGFDAFVLGINALRELPAAARGEAFAPPFGTMAAVAFASVSSTWSYFMGAKTVLAATRARPADPADPSHRQLLNVVEEMTIASGLPMPKVYVLPDADPNAFATGRDPEHAHVAVTEGLLKTLNREELQGVVAHEMSHVRNYDIRLMTIVAVLVGTIALLSDWAARSRLGIGGGGSRRGRDRDSGGNVIVLIIWIVAVIVAPLLAQLAALAVSRRREYLADASAAEMTRNPLALASALEKVEAAVGPTRSISRGYAHLCIADPLERKLDNKEGFVADLFATHPPMSKRIEALRAMGYAKQPVNV